MDELSLIPYVPPENDHESIPEPQIRPPQKKSFSSLVSVFLCAVAVFFYAASAALQIKDADISARYFVRLMIGDLAGGVGNVYALPSGGDGYSHDDTSEKNAYDSSLEKLERLDSGEIVPSVINTETPYEIDFNTILSEERAIQSLDRLCESYGASAPVVLILHTHGTEAYNDHADNGYRTDGKDGVIGIGSVIAEELKENGINALHCEVAFDEPDFNSAYYSAAIAIRDYIREYPSISYIIDVHRDSITLPDGTPYATEAEIDGKSAAKLMFVVGTDYAGSGHIGWRDNLALCARLEVAIEGKNPGVMRGLNIRAASFNEQYSKGSMLLEVGSCANTFEEAARSAKEFASALAKEIIG